MKQYEQELRKLVAPSARNPQYSSLVGKLAKLFDVLENEDDRNSVALETLFRATQLVTMAVLPEAWKAYGRPGSCSVDVHDVHSFNAAEHLGDENLRMVESELREWIDVQPWAVHKDEYWRIGVCDHIMRFAAFLMKMRAGGDFQIGVNHNTCLLIIKQELDYKADYRMHTTKLAYPVTKTLLQVINVRKKYFDEKYNEFRESMGVEKLDAIVNSDVDVDRLKQIDWAMLSPDVDALTMLWGMVASEKSLDIFAEKVNRLLRARQSQGTSHVDVEKLRKDAEGMNESVLHRIDMLVDWLRSQQSLTETCRVQREERESLKKQIGIMQVQNAVNSQQLDIRMERDCEAIDFISKCQEEYDIAMRNLSEKTQENAILTQQLTQCQAELAEAMQQIEDKDKQIAAKKSSDKVKVAQEQAEEAKMNYKQLQDNWQQETEKTMAKSRAANIKLLMDGLRQRCRTKTNKETGLLFDDLKDASWEFPELQKAVRELYDELSNEPTQEERRTRAMERQAEKPAAQIRMDAATINANGETVIKDSTVERYYENINLKEKKG